ncbi:Dynein light chain roadblock-type 1 [Cytospora mali]|uniref:Dynein light chain roadblock-type 1 n=1 Tax=Cytospora mali TaxID=578113 RepID=A0A194V8E6_CYTMA|nr:Dynein light chain roadblock-type 1 [Valsa mali var. pyri (nom. inval.)]
MADPTTTNGADALEETLNRLSKKPGVKATIALDRASGAILKTAGQISLLRTAKSQQQQQDSQLSTTAGPGSFSASTGDVPASSGSAAAAGTGSETQGAEEMAAMVWAFVNTAGSLVEGLDAEDELKLLRLRTKKQELVIVPDARYLLIVVHETPAA